MKIIFLILLLVFGIATFQESFSEDYFSLPSCYIGTFDQDYVQCSTGDFPPCPEPSFEKNGYCVMHKIDICKAESVLDDGACIEHDEYFADESRVTGNMAQEICSITGGECPQNYFANVLDDGSKMVAVTNWDADTKIEKSFAFVIKNNTLSYDVRENEN